MCTRIPTHNVIHSDTITCIRTCTHIHTHIHTLSHVYTHSYTRTHTITCVHIHKHNLNSIYSMSTTGMLFPIAIQFLKTFSKAPSGEDIKFASNPTIARKNRYSDCYPCKKWSLLCSHTIEPNNETCLVTCATWLCIHGFLFISIPQPGYKVLLCSIHDQI